MKVERWMETSGGRVLVVTSAAGGEGKSVTALNLSLALSTTLKGRVLLVDSDLRRPQVHHYLGLKTTKGLSDLLAQPGDGTCFYISKVGNLDVITGGAPPSNPLGLLASTQARELLARLRKEYQLIVLDSPPIVPIADSHILAGLADGVIVVVRARQTRRRAFPPGHRESQRRQRAGRGDERHRILRYPLRLRISALSAALPGPGSTRRPRQSELNGRRSGPGGNRKDCCCSIRDGNGTSCGSNRGRD